MNWLPWSAVIIAAGSALMSIGTRLNILDVMQHELADIAKLARETSAKQGILESRFDANWQERERVLRDNTEAHSWFDQRLRALEVK